MSELLEIIQQVKEDKQRHKAWNSLYWTLGEGFIQRSKAEFYQINAVDSTNCSITIMGEEFLIRDDGMVSFRGQAVSTLREVERLLEENV